MQLTPARRILVLLVVTCAVGWIPTIWAFDAVGNLARHRIRGYVQCTGSWRDFGNGDCGRFLGMHYSPELVWFELIVCLALLLAVGWALIRWALAPFRTMTDTVERLGPTSLGLRLNATGPHDESRRLSDAVDGLLDRVAEGYESQRRFAANASHELRTPLATQRALIEVSLADALTPEQLELLSRQLLATNERNERLIEGLLALAETERGLVVRGPQRLDEIASEAVERWRPMAERAGISLDAEVGEAVVSGEHPLLERLVSNLLENAIKYNDRGGWVRLTVESPGTLVVSNSGPEVPSEVLPRLLEPFQRLSGERLEHSGGAGLGLTIVRSIVAAHEGDLDLRAQPGGGLVVIVHLRPSEQH